MPDVFLNIEGLTTVSATTAPASGTSEVWTVTALDAGIPALAAGDTYALVDSTAGTSLSQQSEVIRVTACTGAGATSVTVMRGCDGTIPVAHANPSTFAFIVPAASIVERGWPEYAAPPEDYRLKNNYDQLRGIYNWKSSNTRNLDQGISNAMIAGAESGGAGLGGMTEWLWIGDSGSAGANSTIGTTQYDRLRSVPIACRDSLANLGVPVGGSGFIRFADNVTSDARIATTGSWTNTTANLFSNTLSSTITITADRAATQLDIWYFQQAAAGTFTVSINGASSGPNFATISAAGSAIQRRTRMPGVSIEKGSKIVITITVAGSGTYFSGVNMFVPNGGLIVHNVAQTSSQAGGSGTAAKNWSDFSAAGLGSVFFNLSQGFRTVADAVFTSGSANVTSATANFTADDVGKPVMVGTSGSGKALLGQAYIVSVTNTTTIVINQNAVQSLSAQGLQIGRPPSVLHIELGLNDLWNGRTVAQVIADITTIRNQFPTQAQGTDVVLHLYGEMNYTYIPAATQRAFWQAMYKLADTFDCPLYDWRDRVGTYAQGQVIDSYGDFFAHFTSATTSDIGAQFAIIVGGGNGLPSHANAPVKGEDLANRRWIEDNYGRSSRVVPGAAVGTTVETIVAQVKIPANMMKVGTLFKYSAVYKAAIATIHTVRIRVGTAGTTSDAAVVAMSAGASSVSTKYAEGNSSVQNIGTAATHLGAGTETQGAATQAGIATATSGTFDSTKDVFVSLSIQSGTSNATTMYSGELEVKL